ncbi:A24 family peptidase [Desulforamulus ruminis]
MVFITTYCAYTDAKNRMIPDNITIPVLLAGVVYHLSLGNGSPFFIKGMIPGFIIWLLALFRPDWIGAGDGKLLIAMGGWLGWLPVCIVILIAYYVALVWSLMKKYFRKQQPSDIPFGVCIFAGLLLYGIPVQFIVERVRLIGS